MTRALGSSWPFSAPCRAHVGSAWCRLGQDSPNDAMASHETLRDLSRTSNSSLPNVWQMELIDQVTWCSSATRTRLAQKKAVSAPWMDIPHSPPIRAGSRSETATSAGNKRSTRRIRRSASRSGENFSCEVLFGSNSQPMCAYTRPLDSAFQSSPYRHGECGSPSLSLYLWWRRWSDTQVMTGPSMARLPATARPTRRPVFALNEPWVKYRWYPTVIPSPDTQ